MKASVLAIVFAFSVSAAMAEDVCTFTVANRSGRVMGASGLSCDGGKIERLPAISSITQEEISGQISLLHKRGIRLINCQVHGAEREGWSEYICTLSR